ncbi:hypothetical protein [Paenibacillus daejeonensis]|uniref:hypothetical protein n=1 Tax=Paenibacillus daejeonensis TaxID=135193 RepID=UPI00036665E7|nr:hypothetical protein [Paenibacillus daejeonensis]
MDYKLNIGGRHLVLGTTIDTDSTLAVSGKQGVALQDGEWDLMPGLYSARNLAEHIGTLLDAVCIQLGNPAAAGVLLDNLEASLSTTAREAVLPASSLDADNTWRAWAERAERIGAKLTQWARESRTIRASEPRSSAVQSLALRSRCEQHLWTAETVRLLMGSAGSPMVMQLYNEYLHQFVLLRDLLLPFANWDVIPIPVGVRRKSRGLREVSEARERFLTGLFTKRLPHRELVRFAQEVLQPGLGEPGYGFQYEAGLVLPAALGCQSITAATPLLRWYPAVLANAESELPGAVIFDYVHDDYEGAPRSWVDDPGYQIGFLSVEEGLQGVREAVIAAQLQLEAGRTTLSYTVMDSQGKAYAVDVGQMLRGYRYMYREAANLPSAETARAQPHDEVARHKPESLLSLPGLVDSQQGGVHLIDTYGNPLILWALIGKLHPANLVLLPSRDPEAITAAQHTGKSFGAKFLLYPAS